MGAMVFSLGVRLSTKGFGAHVDKASNFEVVEGSGVRGSVPTKNRWANVGHQGSGLGGSDPNATLGPMSRNPKPSHKCHTPTPNRPHKALNPKPVQTKARSPTPSTCFAAPHPSHRFLPSYLCPLWQPPRPPPRPGEQGLNGDFATKIRGQGIGFSEPPKQWGGRGVSEFKLEMRSKLPGPGFPAWALMV